MTKDNIVRFLKLLNAGNIHPADEWVRCSCLFAKHKHASGKDSSPSGGIKIEQGKSFYWCFTCGSSGQLDDILFELDYFSTKSNDDAAVARIQAAFSFLADEDQFVFEPIDFDKLENPHKFNEFPESWPESFSSIQSSNEAVAYLKKRNVPEQLWSDLGLRFDHGKQAIMFPYRNALGKVAGARGRIIDTTYKVGHHDYSYKGKNNTSTVWFRESEFSEDPKPLIVVEGQFDYSRIYQQYRNVTAILTALVSEYKLDRLRMMCSKVLWMADHDTAGNDSREKAQAFFTKHGFPFGEILIPDDYVVTDPKTGKTKADPDMIPANHLKYLLKEYVDLDELIV